MSDDLKPCPHCSSPYGYAMNDTLWACSECQHEWNPKQADDTNERLVVDVNGNPLKDGDAVIVIKDLPVKGAPKPIKKGTKVKRIRLVDGDHDISCKIDGFGAMGLKSEFVKKA